MANDSSLSEPLPTLLVVEEDAAVRHLLELTLTHASFEVLLASNGKDGVELYRRYSSKIRLVLMDVNMPVMDGPGALREMQQIDSRVSCCFMSGDTSAARLPELLAMGARRLLTKPFSSLHELMQTVRELIHETGDR